MRFDGVPFVHLLDGQPRLALEHSKAVLHTGAVLVQPKLLLWRRAGGGDLFHAGDGRAGFRKLGGVVGLLAVETVSPVAAGERRHARRAAFHLFKDGHGVSPGRGPSGEGPSGCSGWGKGP